MDRATLKLYKMTDNEYQGFIKSNHGRKIYVRLSIENGVCQMLSCFYIDRSTRPSPTLFKTNRFPLEDMLSVFGAELDKKFHSYEIHNNPVMQTEEFIQHIIGTQKYKILILLKEGNTLKTIFKNRMRREIYMEIILNEAKSYIKECRYCDTRGDESQNKITPYRLVTVFFEHDNEYRAILNIVNNELECGFTDVVVSESHTIKLDRPICGSI